MPLNWKRLALIAGFILLVGLIGFGLYRVFLQPALPTIVVGPGGEQPLGGGLQPAGSNANIPIVNINTGILPPGAVVPLDQPDGVLPGQEVSLVAAGGLVQVTQVTSDPVRGVGLAADQDSLNYYDANDGKFYRVDGSGNSTPLSDKIFYQVDSVTWSPDAGSAIIEYPDGANIIYDFSNQEQITLPKHWADFSFSPSGKELAFKSLGQSEDSRWLVIADRDGSQATQVEHLGYNDATVYPSWSPNNQIIGMYSEPKDANRQNLYFLGRNDENFPLTVVEGYDFKGTWSPDGQQLLYSVYGSDASLLPSLWIVEANGQSIGQNRRDLQLQTWADKCAFADAATAYCAVPRQLSAGAGLFRDELTNVPSDIYKIDLASGFRTLVASPETNHAIQSLVVPGDGQSLYYVSENDGRLYQLRLR